jgi:tetratricopeptide (TPR) repeat protein
MAVSAAFLSAFEAHRAGRMAEAEKGYRAVLATEPGNADAWHLMGLVEQHRGDLNTAVKLIQKALSISGPNADFLANLGVIYEDMKRSADAVVVLEQALKIDQKAFTPHFALGNALRSLGRLDEALAHYERAAALQPQNPSVHNNMGGVLVSLGRPEAAVQSYRQVIALQPNHGASHYNLGMVLKDMRQPAEAAECFRRAIALLPEFVEADINLAAVLQDKALLEQAVAKARSQAILTPSEATAAKLGLALSELAAWHKRSGHLDVAVELFMAATERCPKNPVFRNNLGNTLLELDRSLEAEEQLRTAVALAPTLPEGHYNLGNALKALGRLDEALACYQDALALRPTFTKARINLGGILSQRGAYDEALSVYTESERLGVVSADLLDTKGVVLQTLGRVEEGVACFRRALDVNPDLASAHRNLGIAALMSGDFGLGWAEYEWRWRCDMLKDTDRKFPYPVWQGEPGPGGIVVWGEQGVGDRVLYAGMIPDLLARGHQVVMETDPRLHALFERSFPGVVAVPKQNPPHPSTSAEGIRWHSALASLGRYLRPDAASFPTRGSYLRADEARTAQYRADLDRLGKAPVVGISWGSRNPKLGRHKTLELMAWAPLLQTSGVRFVDLQYGDTTEERAAAEAALGVSIVHMPDLDLREDLDGVAALINACDLVISISNTTVHLAAGLGKPTWVLVPAAAGNLWYWMRGTVRSPWYESATIIRQKIRGQWDEIIADVKSRLDVYLAGVGKDA